MGEGHRDSSPQADEPRPEGEDSTDPNAPAPACQPSGRSADNVDENRPSPRSDDRSNDETPEESEEEDLGYHIVEPPEEDEEERFEKIAPGPTREVRFEDRPRRREDAGRPRSRKPPPPARARRPLWVVLAAAGVALGLIMLILWLTVFRNPG